MVDTKWHPVHYATRHRKRNPPTCHFLPSQPPATSFQHIHVSLYPPPQRPASDPYANRIRFGKSNKEAVEVHPQRVSFVPNCLPGVRKVVDKNDVEEDVDRDLSEVSVPRCDVFERHVRPDLLEPEAPRFSV